MCTNCAFYNKSIKLCTVVKHDMKRILGYRDIADMTCEKNGYRLMKMAIISAIDMVIYSTIDIQ